MTSIFVFAVLLAANIAYSIYDSRRIQAARQMDAFCRVESRKTCLSGCGERALLSGRF